MTAPPLNWGEDIEFSTPQDQAAERSLLATLAGGINGSRRDILADLSEEDFVHPAHRPILTALRGLDDAGDEVNLITLRDALLRAGALGRVGGIGHLSDILASEEVGRPLVLVRILKRKRRFRDLIHLGTQLTQAGISEAGDPDEQLERLLSTAGQASSSVLTIHQAGEFLDFQVPDIQWVVTGLVPQGVPQVLASKGGLGKSWLALQMLVSVATGKPYFDYEPASPKGAAYFGLEDGRDVVHKRIRAIVDDLKWRGVWTHEDEQNLRANFSVISVNWEADSASTYLPTLMPALSAYLSKVNSDPGLIVLDTLARFAEGDENSVQALRPIMAACSKIAANGWTPLLLHHVGKGQDGAKSKDKPTLADRMSTEWIRGSSSIVDNSRGVLQLVGLREDEAEKAGLDADKARSGGYLILGATKTNGAPRAEWRLLEQSDSGVWVLPDDAAGTLAKLRGPKAVEVHAKGIAFLLELFHATKYGLEPNKENICNMLSPGSKNPEAWFRQNLRRLRNSGMVERDSMRVTVLGMSRCHAVTM